ncbi:probable calcium-binding protein CML30 [Tanacetum coccineum]
MSYNPETQIRLIPLAFSYLHKNSMELKSVATAQPSTGENTTCRPTPSAVAQAHDTIQVFHANNGREKSLGLNLEIVLKRLGMFCDHDDKRQIIGSNEISGLFDEDEPSLDEVKEAFSAFDRNKDGFIDAKVFEMSFQRWGIYKYRKAIVD